MESATVNRVRTVWERGSGPLKATLTFRAGTLHEALHERGASEVIAESVMGSIFDSGASVGVSCTPDTTVFFVIGEPSQVSASLVEIARVLGALTPGRVEVGRRRLGGHRPPRDQGTHAWLAHRLYGHTGLGRAWSDGPHAYELSDEDVAEVAQRCFHRDNAVLAFTSDPPDLSGFSLPSGTRHPQPRSVDVGHPRACVLRAPLLGATLALEVPGSHAGRALLGLLPHRLRGALADAGIAAPLDAAASFASRERLLATYVSWCAADAAPTAARALRLGLASVLRQPPTPEELAAAEPATGAAEDLAGDDEGAVDARLDEAGARLLRALEPESVLAPRPGPLLPRDVVGIAVEALTHAILVVPGIAPGPPVGSLPDRTAWRPPSPDPVTKGEVVRRRRRRGGDLDAVVLGAEGFTVRMTSGLVETMLWESVVGLERREEVRVVHAADGRRVRLDVRGLTSPDLVLDTLDDLLAHVSWTRV